METTAVLKISGEDFEVGEFLARNPRLRPVAVWKKGDLGRLRRINDTSGFSLLLGEGQVEEVFARVQKAFLRLATVFSDAERSGADAILDFAMFVWSEQQFSARIMFSPAELRFFSDRGVHLAVSSYPVSDEADDGGESVEAAAAKGRNHG